jgi:Glycosyltransferase like family 2
MLSSATALDTRADLRLWLTPDWTRPETWLGALSRYVVHAPALGSTCLCLEVGEAERALAADLAAVACETLAHDRAFAPVLLVVGDVDRRDAVLVRDGAGVLAALGVQAPPTPTHAEQIVARARRGKLLADELLAIADHHLMTLGGDPWLEPEPLVTVPVPTWKGDERLMQRTLPSILLGTYRNVEVLVCSDGPDPAARAAVEALAARDARVRHLELLASPHRPSHPRSFWETTGLHAANRALEGARGRFVAPLEHDDQFTSTHVADLLARARQERADLVHAQALCERPSGPPQLVGRERLTRGHVSPGAVLYSDRLAHMRYDTACWLLEEPGDWNMWRRMQEHGARVAFLDRVVLLHTAERTIEEHAGDSTTRFGAPRTAADLASDVLGTDASWYLEVEPAAAEACG